MNRSVDRSSVTPELATALVELTNLIMATSTVSGLLEDLCALATTVTIPPASCGITLAQDHQPLTVASSDELAARLDEVQYGQDEGPCLHTLRTGEVTVVDDLAQEQRWRSYVARALGHGARSSLSLPLTVNGSARGALNIYARMPGAFGATERQRAEIFARQASAALAVVTRQAEQTQLTDQLRAALATRAVIDQALGILMAQQHCGHDEAFSILRSTSQHQNRKLRDVAAEIVESVTGEPARPPRFDDPS